MQRNARIYIAGHRGLVGSALVRRLQAEGYKNPITATHAELDLIDQHAVDAFFREQRPEYVFLAAAKVGGIHANATHPAEFIRDNLAIQTNVIHSAWQHGAKKLLFLGSSCIYPRDCPQPIKEEYLLTGPLEPTNRAYAIAKIAGLEMCQAYRRQYGFDAIVAMPTNLYGPGDNYDAENAHVVAALMRRFHEAKLANAPEVVVWGSGMPRREFLHVDDLADACLHLMRIHHDSAPVNVGTGIDLPIAELASLLRELIGYGGRLRYDSSKPDGTPAKRLDVSRLQAMGWRATHRLDIGLAETYRWFSNHATMTAS